MYFFQSKRLGFRQWKDTDAKVLAEMNQDPRVMEFFPDLLSEEETLAIITRIQNDIDQRSYGWFAVDELASGLFIGFIGISHPRFESFFTPCLEIGWRLHPDFWGKGYATEGAMACLKYAFEHLEVSSIYSFTTVANKRSERVMMNVGMNKIGEFEHPMLPNHPLGPHVLYVIHKT
jgi:RimJ/RimL family protein N-acetyltransferase